MVTATVTVTATVAAMATATAMVTAMAMAMVSHALEDLDEIREKILAKAGNLPFNIYGDRSVPRFFRYLMTGSLTDPATGDDTVGTQLNYIVTGKQIGRASCRERVLRLV